MTNKELIMRYKLENGMDLETELYTFAVWKNMGYQVKKGEKSKHKTTLWKTVVKENEEGKSSQKCFPKTVSLFTKEQVERIG